MYIHLTDLAVRAKFSNKEVSIFGYGLIFNDVEVSWVAVGYEHSIVWTDSAL